MVVEHGLSVVTSKIALAVFLAGWMIILFWVASVPASKSSFQSPVVLNHGAPMTGLEEDVIVVVLAS